MDNKARILKGIAKARLGIPTPVFCHWDITHVCNMNCSFCNVMKGRSAWMPELDTQGALHLVDQLGSLGVAILNISGGEPLLRKDLGIIIARAKKRGMSVFVATNGWLVKERAHLLKDAYAIRVSIDGVGEFHDRFRLKGAYDRAVEAVRLLKKMGKNVAINSVINTQTPDEEIDKLCRLAKSLEVQISMSNCSVSVPSKKGPGLDEVSQEVVSLRVQEQWFVGKMKQLRKKYPGLIADPPVFYTILEQGGLAEFGCQVLHLEINIKPDGSVAMPCGGWAAKSAKGDLAKIWNSLQANRVRKKVGKYDFCKNCNVKCHILPSLLMKNKTLIQLGLSYRV